LLTFFLSPQQQDDRRVSFANCWMRSSARSGAPWCGVLEEFGPWKTVYNHFDRWNADGTLDQVRKRLLSRFVAQDQTDKELWFIDGTIVRAARCAAGGGKK
jgi:transposase